MASEDDNYGSLLVKGTPVAELKVNDIKKELDKRGLSKAGSKTQMLERLKAQLLLEKLQQDAAQSSGDELEGKVPNMALQQESAGQSEFVRQYLEQQQKNLERQMEVKKQVEEERKRKSADESSADETVTHQDSSKPKIDPEVTSPKKFKDDSNNAPATEESKMPRPARKSSRNVSKGENGQDGGIVKEKSRSPSPEKESLRERTRSGSSSSSRSATPEATTRRGRPTRGVRGGRRGGRRGRGRPQVRKGSRSSSHSSTEEEVMPKKRSRRSTNSRSSRSRSRSPKKTSPDLTPATRRSSRRISTTKTPPDTDITTDATASEFAPKERESPATKNEDVIANEKQGDDESKVSEMTEDAKAAGVKEVRRSVEVLEPAAGTIKTIEIANITNENRSGAWQKSQDTPSNGETVNDNEDTKDSGEVDGVAATYVANEGDSDKAPELSSETEKVIEPESKHKEAAVSDKEKAKPDHEQDTHNFTVSTDILQDSTDVQKSLGKKYPNALDQTSKQVNDDKNIEANKRRQRSDSSSSSSSSSPPPRKRERSDSSGSSTDVSPSAREDLSKRQADKKYTLEVSKLASTDSDKRSQPVRSKDQDSETQATDNPTAQDHREKFDGNPLSQLSPQNGGKEGDSLEVSPVRLILSHHHLHFKERETVALMLPALSCQR
ncbi:hypothetical protein RRG08_025409 [Elysia crispata]|uniref:SAP domain-containing protein n=1 Tax=Elysia crispata TaxID=231223 RepID=A0AAE0Z8S3_9GAST|nr:hypothetical protein RRG08_025409 [Elysia crispata]